MATVAVVDDTLHVKLSGWEAFFALRRSVSAPVEDVVSAEAGTITGLRPHGIRLPGSYVPGVIAAGSYWWKETGWSFWSVRKPRQAVDIRLRDHHFSRIVVQVEDPYATAAMIENAVRSNR